MNILTARCRVYFGGPRNVGLSHPKRTSLTAVNFLSLLIGITRLRLSQERIKNRLYILVLLFYLPFQYYMFLLCHLLIFLKPKFSFQAPLGSRPLLQWSLNAMVQYGGFDSLWVSTDHPAIATCATSLPGKTKILTKTFFYRRHPTDRE